MTLTPIYVEFFINIYLHINTVTFKKMAKSVKNWYDAHNSEFLEKLFYKCKNIGVRYCHWY